MRAERLENRSSMCVARSTDCGKTFDKVYSDTFPYRGGATNVFLNPQFFEEVMDYRADLRLRECC